MSADVLGEILAELGRGDEVAVEVAIRDEVDPGRPRRLNATRVQFLLATFVQLLLSRLRDRPQELAAERKLPIRRLAAAPVVDAVAFDLEHERQADPASVPVALVADEQPGRAGREQLVQQREHVPARQGDDNDIRVQLESHQTPGLSRHARVASGRRRRMSCQRG